MGMRRSLFSELSRKDMDIIENYGQIHHYPKNRLLIQKGEECDCLYIIKEGRVKIYISDEYGAEMILRFQGAGEYFGELALIDEGPRSASVATVDPCRLVYVGRARFEECLRDNPDISVKLICSMSKRIRDLTEDLSNCALKTVYQRMRMKLVKLAVEQDGRRVIPQRMTHQEIAGLVGSGREMISRLMKKLENGGYIEVRKKQISILKNLPRNLSGR